MMTKENVVLWISIILIIDCLLFPPYGYSKTKTTIFFEHAYIEPVESEDKHAWTYVENDFIFASPPVWDSRLKPLSAPHTTSYISIEDMGIGWHIVIVECLVVIFIGGTLLITLQKRKIP